MAPRRRVRRDPARARSAEAYARRVHTDAAFQIAADAWEEAGDRKQAELMQALQPSAVTRRELEHRYQSLRELRSEILDIERNWRNASRRERAEAIQEAVNYVERDPETFADRTYWVFNGTMGAGAMYRARQIANSGTRTNRVAQLFTLVLMLDETLPPAAVTQVWRRLSPAARHNVDRIMNAALRTSGARRSGVRRSGTRRAGVRRRPS